MAGSPPLDVAFAAVTDAGLTRSHNEDRYRADPRIGLFLVADGVGGEAAGEIASECVAATIHRFVEQTNDDSSLTWPFGFDPMQSEGANRIRVGALLANRAVAERIAEDENLKGMASTMSALLVRGRRAVAANIGDCRVYLFREGTLKQITVDHSWVSLQVQAGLIDAEAARRHPMRHIVTRALAGRGELEVDLHELDLQPGDAMLLCSDGLTSMVPDQGIQQHLVASLPDTAETCRALVQAANDGGGKDNITVLIVHLSESPTPAALP